MYNPPQFKTQGVQNQGQLNNVMPPPPTGASPMPGAPPRAGGYSPFKGGQAPAQPPGMPPADGAQFAGVNTVGASAGPADYEGVQGFADQAYQQARRTLDPQQEQMQRRTQQDLINKGIDPSSPQGMAMLDQENRNITDQDNSALFGALQFGQGVQQQMFGQSMQNTMQAGNMQQAQWNRDLGERGQDVTKYGMDQNFKLGQGQLDMGRQGQDFNQMMSLENTQFRDRQYGDRRSDYQDALTMSLMGMTPIPGVIGYDPSGLAGTQINASGGGGFLGGI